MRVCYGNVPADLDGCLGVIVTAKRAFQNWQSSRVERFVILHCDYSWQKILAWIVNIYHICRIHILLPALHCASSTRIMMVECILWEVDAHFCSSLSRQLLYYGHHFSHATAYVSPKSLLTFQLECGSLYYCHALVTEARGSGLLLNCTIDYPCQQQLQRDNPNIYRTES